MIGGLVLMIGDLLLMIGGLGPQPLDVAQQLIDLIRPGVVFHASPDASPQMKCRADQVGRLGFLPSE